MNICRNIQLKYSYQQKEAYIENLQVFYLAVNTNDTNRQYGNENIDGSKHNYWVSEYTVLSKLRLGLYVYGMKDELRFHTLAIMTVFLLCFYSPST